ncbi:MAG: Ku protein [Syntrophales bacterium]|nr:Ku protein [Syntrophales bacterium]
MPEDEEETLSGARSFWSGSITFGLVSVPVNLYSANRPKAVSLKMIDRNGTPLSRRYICPRENRPVGQDEIVRGYEIEKEEYVVVTDEELEKLEPKKSREIELSRFVELSEIDRLYFERAYYLVPEGSSGRAYRLLAHTMERKGRAGIATFVMRGKEHVVAIIAEKGILRAETLRFHDEIRSAEDVGLPEIEKAPDRKIGIFTKEIEKRTGKELDRGFLADRYAERLLALVRRKVESQEGVVKQKAPGEESEGAEIIDLMEVLKRSVKESKGTEPPKKKKKAAGLKERARLYKKSKTELYEKAQELEIPGRSRMSKEELAQAIEKSS